MRPHAKQPARGRGAGIFPLSAFSSFAIILLFAAILPISAAAAQARPAAPPNPKAFVGTWTASFQGAPFMTIRFTMKDGKLTGEMSNGKITVDQDGNITSVSVLPGEKSLTIEKVEHNAVYLRHTKEKKQSRYAFRLNDQTHAQLEFLTTPPLGIAPIKPILLVKKAKKR